jgi:hypothetical protein
LSSVNRRRKLQPMLVGVMVSLATAVLLQYLVMKKDVSQYLVMKKDVSRRM